MQFSSINPLSGPNVWSRKSVLEVCCVQNQPDQVLAATAARHDSGEPLHSAHMILERAIELQRVAGTPVEYGCVDVDSRSGLIRIIFEFVAEPLGRLALEIAAQLVAQQQAGEPVDTETHHAQLRACAERYCFGRTTGAVVAAARARGIPVTRLDDDCLIQLGHGARQRRLQGVITDRTGYLAEAVSRDKELTKTFLKRLGIPVAPGRVVRDADEAWTVACELGLPVVVKPRDADYGNGVSVHLKTRPEIVAAFDAACRFSEAVLVERHVPGCSHRLLVVSDAVVAAVRRDPAQVRGDGRRTVRELILAANRDPRRGDGPLAPWFPITVDEEVTRVLSEQGLSLTATPPAGQTVVLRHNAEAQHGGKLVDVTDEIHPDVAMTVIAAVQAIGLDVAGVDLVTTDIRRPLAEQGGAILEINAGPAIVLHLSPSCQPPRPVAEAVVESLIPLPKQGRIPIVALLGDKGTSDMARGLGTLLAGRYQTIGMAVDDGVFVGGRRIKSGPATDAAGCRTLLLHSAVECALCAVSPERVRNEGLAFDECRVVIATAHQPAHEQVLRLLVETLHPAGAVIANVDDPSLAAEFAAGDLRLVAVALDSDNPFLRAHQEAGGMTVFSECDAAVIARGKVSVGHLPLADDMLFYDQDDMLFHDVDDMLFHSNGSPSPAPQIGTLVAIATAFVLGADLPAIADRLTQSRRGTQSSRAGIHRGQVKSRSSLARNA